MNYFLEIKSIFEKLGAKDIGSSNAKDISSMLFTIDIEDAPRTLLILLNESNNKVVLNLIFTFKQGYQNPGLDFYEILEKLNNNIILGNLHFLEEKSIKYISYKATYIGDKSNFIGNNSFEYFLSVCIDIIGLNIVNFGKG
jgi:hypothetical protein